MSGPRDQLEDQKELVDEVVSRKEFVVGFLYHSKQDLEDCRAKGEKLRVKVLGMYKVGDDVTKELATSVIDEVNVLGSLKGPKDVVEALKTKREEGS